MSLNNKLSLNIEIDKPDIVIFGYGEMCKEYLHEIRKYFNVRYIIDNNYSKIGKDVEGIKIISYERYLRDKINTKIIVSTHYIEIKKQLIDSGKIENEDFFNIYEFIPKWHWSNSKKVHIFKAEIMITTRCTLNCKKCGMFIPQYKVHKDRDIKHIKEDLDCFFSIIDRVYIFNILGGEPLLHKNLEEIVDYIGENYSSKIGLLTITTNGTVILSKQLIKIIKKYNIQVNISDYSISANYNSKVDTNEKILRDYNINYNRNKEIWWYDLGFPDKNLSFNDNPVQHMKSCSLVCRGISGKKFYYCHLAWSAVNCGLINDDKNDYIDLSKLNFQSDEDREKLVYYETGHLKKGCLSLCKNCAGMGEYNENRIESGIQLSGGM